VVPTHNAAAGLQSLLAGLAEQTEPAETFEVVVVLDGCTDSSIDVVERWQSSRGLAWLRCVEQPHRGAAAARNAGVAEARSPIVLFLSDDLVPDSRLLAVHVRQHQRADPIAVLGDYQVMREPEDGTYLWSIWAENEDRCARRALPDRLSCYTDFCAANASLRRADVIRVGGFEADFAESSGGDHELGYRLLTAGVRFVPDGNATARCHHRRGLPQALQAAYDEARADVAIGRRHPELRRGLRLASGPGNRLRRLVDASQAVPTPPDRLSAAFLPLLQVYDALKLRRRWLHLWRRLCRYAYWHGVLSTVGSWEALNTYRAGAPPAPSIEVDISLGLPESIREKVWVHGPSSLLLRALDRRLGTLELSGPLEEPLLPHLAEEITRQFGTQMLLMFADSRLRSEVAPAELLPPALHRP
jgi:glycosyltransferase involved in cell wall biosynthesis